jgi:ubiquinone/menaquinone biosynthesis C-methylase UbiE
MKLLESSEKRYDTGINLLTFGNDQKLKEEIASKFISEGEQIFEIGVGTGTLAILCAKKGAHVTGIDISTKMLEIAKRKIQKAGLAEKIELKKMSVVEMDTHVPDNSFGKVISTLVFSELSEGEQRFALREAHRVLKSNGKIIILDEVVPRSLEKKILYYLIRIPLKAVTYLFAQTTTKPLRNIEEKLADAHFRMEVASRYFLDSLQLIVASKRDHDEN